MGTKVEGINQKGMNEKGKNTGSSETCSSLLNAEFLPVGEAGKAII